ncbi:MAG: hypothetical protein HXX12_15340 [Geothrix sp.]|uniref:hypothetical protein n=1 Tax=Geothrix sp. TaxID=1962974 RepID=UPI0017AC041B|nr:hypothetical protein [Geothrix sp.]NWJ42333.1 hypothetical protein [Geothrix sp.]WIL19699.1 MAG: hypothetical protein QOZ81_002227 [Geothrix sp.]
MQVSLEMSLNREDFLRLLPGAVGGVEVAEADGVFRGAECGLRWTIRLRPLPDRRLGSVVLPCQAVEISLEGHTEVEAEAFMARFHRGFQRGGG